MSLVNDMLRDLEKKPLPRGNANDIATSEKVTRGSRISGFLPASIAFVVVAAAVYFSVDPRPEGELSLEPESSVDSGDIVGAKPPLDSVPESAVALNESLSRNNAPGLSEEGSKRHLQGLLERSKTDYFGSAVNQLTQVPEPIQVPKQAPEAKTLAQTEPSSGTRTVVKTSTRSALVEQILDRGKRALRLDRLTSPIGDNAFDYYLEVLTHDADNKEALTGLNIIAERYVELAQNYAREGNTTRASVLLRRARAVAPSHPAIDNFWPNINRYGYAISDTPRGNNVPVKTQLIQQEASAEGRPRVIASTDPALVEPSDNARVTVVRDPQWKDQQLADKTRALIARGETSSSRLQLRAFVAANPNSPRSVRVLFELLLSEQDYFGAKQLLSQNQELPGIDLAIMSSYWFLAQNDLAGVAGLINTQPASYDADLTYLSLKAGVLHKLSRYQESAAAYGKLLQGDPANTAFWLGLAVAQDAMKEQGLALSSFKRALQGQNNPDVRRYISARIDALSVQQTTQENTSRP